MANICIIPQTTQEPDLFITFLSKKKTKGTKKKIFKKIGFKGRKNDFCHLNEQLYFGITSVKSKDDWRLLGYKVGQEVQKFKGAKKIAFNDDLPVSSQEFFEGLFLAYYSFEKYKSKKSKLKQSFLIDNFQAMEPAMYRARSIINAQCLVRDLVNTPAEDMHQNIILKTIYDTFRASNIKVDVYTKSDLEKFKMRGHLAVNRASKHPAMTIRLTYEPELYKKDIVMVGKGLIYDTGGLSLKPIESMLHMKLDKAGAMTLIGFMKSVSELGSKNKITSYIALAENAISEEAYKPGDIYKMKNKKTVLIENTDAEGRLVLIDNLTLAEKQNPKLDEIYSFATLTGAAVKAFGEETAALSGFNEKLKSKMIKSGENVDELYANAKFNKYMLDSLKTDQADISHIANRSSMGSQTAGLFLTYGLSKKNIEKFVHCDFAGPAYALKPWGTNIKGGTGFSVRTLIEMFC